MPKLIAWPLLALVLAWLGRPEVAAAQCTT
jgi:hypothetical protein